MTDTPLLQAMGLPVATLLQADSAPGFRVETLVASKRAYRGGPRREEIAILAREGWRDAVRDARELAAWRASQEPDAPPIDIGDLVHGRPPRTAAERGAASAGARTFRQITRIRDLSGRGEAWRFLLQPTYYYYFLGTNGAARKRIFSRDPGEAAELAWLTAAESNDIHDFRGSVLANPLTVNLVLTTQGPHGAEVLVQVRKPGPRPSWRLQTSAAGFVDFEDIESGGDDGAVVAMAREAREETGLPLDYSSISFTAFARVPLAGFTGLSARATLPTKPPRIEPAPEFRFEVDRFEWWRWSPEATLARVKEQERGWSAFNPVGGAAIVHALVAEFGEERVRRAWQS